MAANRAMTLGQMRDLAVRSLDIVPRSSGAYDDCGIRFAHGFGSAMHRAHPIDRYVGARLRMRRLRLRMSQSEVGQVVGVTYQQVQKYEKGESRISASCLQRLCTALNVPVSFFFQGAPQMRGLSEAPEVEDDAGALVNFLATTDGLTLADTFTRIRNPKVRRALVALIEQIVDKPDGTAG
jgi:transcriptional regulator with XRE-family HTH domain